MSHAPHTLDPAMLARLNRLHRLARRCSDGLLAGGHLSRRIGTGGEFAEHRPYVPGDDLRHLDWKVFARRDRYVVRQHRHEAGQACHLLLDASPSMQFGSTPHTKFLHACLLAEIIAHLALRQHDPVAAGLFGHDTPRYIPPQHGRTFLNHFSHLIGQNRSEAVFLHSPLSILHSASSRTAARTASISTIPPTIAQSLQSLPLHSPSSKPAAPGPRRGLIVILSDLLDEPDTLAAIFTGWTRAGHEVAVLQIIDPAERRFTLADPTMLVDVENGTRHPLDPRHARAGYLAALSEHCRALLDGCGRAGIPCLLADTSESPEGVLGRWLRQRRPGHRADLLCRGGR